VKSLAAVLSRPKEPLQLVERELAPPGPGEVTVRIEACGLGLNDWHVAMLDALPVTPLVLGCEAVGRVEATGERVGLGPLATSCGACAWCAAGLPGHCPLASWHGFNRDGALCTHANFARQHLVPLPEEGDVAELAVLMGTGRAADAAVQLATGDEVGVFGLGGLGLLVLQLLGDKAVGIDVDAQRRVLARLTEARGPLDTAIVCVPSVQAVHAAFGMLKPRGRLIIAAQSPNGRFDLSLHALVTRGIEIFGSHLDGSSPGRLLALYAQGKLKPVVTRRPLREAPAALYALRDGGHLGRLVFTDFG
jgi:propanol-preferring alcohol dehydrogenase